MEASPPQQGPCKKLCREEDHPIDVNVLEHIPPQDPANNDLSIESAAFAQYPILKNICTFLNPDDLENCWGISKDWKEVVEPLVSVHYDIQMFFENTKRIILTKRARFHRGNLKRYAMDLENVIKTVEEALETHNQKVVLSLSISGLNFDRRNRCVEDFLSKFGHLVEHLSFPAMQNTHLNVFCMYLLTNFPKLKILDCSCLRLLKDSREFEDFNPNLPKHQLLQLKKINFGFTVDSDAETLGKFLKIGPNLEEILDLPIWFINTLVVADKVPLLKSVLYYLHEVEAYSANGLTVVTAFERLAELQPKLSSFSLNLYSCFADEDSTIEAVKPLIFSILKSSADSLRSFEMAPTEGQGFQQLPQLKGVKTLIFQNSSLQFDDASFFSDETSLVETFPNVSVIRLGTDSWENLINQEILPEIMNSSWGSQIKRLQVRRLPISSLSTIQSVFPLIEDLEFSASVAEIEELLRVFPVFCPQLKSLAITVDGERLRPRAEIMDCAFTGLSPDVVALLLEPSKRGIFSDDQIERFKSQSIISKLTELRRLKLTLNTSMYMVSDEVCNRLTHISYEFGFRLLPHLKVSVENLKGLNLGTSYEHIIAIGYQQPEIRYFVS